MWRKQWGREGNRNGVGSCCSVVKDNIPDSSGIRPGHAGFGKLVRDSPVAAEEQQVPGAVGTRSCFEETEGAFISKAPVKGEKEHCASSQTQHKKLYAPDALKRLGDAHCQAPRCRAGRMRE
jgi:hypothetical protein